MYIYDNDDLCMYVCMHGCVYVSMYIYTYIHKFVTTNLVTFSVYHLLYVPPLTTGSGDWNGHSYLPWDVSHIYLYPTSILSLCWGRASYRWWWWCNVWHEHVSILFYMCRLKAALRDFWWESGWGSSTYTIILQCIYILFAVHIHYV